MIQVEPLWIVFPSNMMIKLKHELIFNSYKTLDGRGANVHIVGGGCITLQYVSNVIIHNIHIHHCHPSGIFTANNCYFNLLTFFLKDSYCPDQNIFSRALWVYMFSFSFIGVFTHKQRNYMCFQFSAFTEYS